MDGTAPLIDKEGNNKIKIHVDAVPDPTLYDAILLYCGDLISHIMSARETIRMAKAAPKVDVKGLTQKLLVTLNRKGA